MGAFLRAVVLAPVLALGLLVATAPAEGSGREASRARPASAPIPLRVEPASAPNSSEGHSDELDGRPGRDDPDEFYKKPPRKRKLKTRMHASLLGKAVRGDARHTSGVLARDRARLLLPGRAAR